MISLILEELKRNINYLLNKKIIDINKIFKNPIKIRTKSGIIITITRKKL